MGTGNSAKPPVFNRHLPDEKTQEAGAKTAVLYITDNGLKLAERLRALYPYALIKKFSSGSVRKLWDENKNIIFIMAAGIVVRTIAPLIKDKKSDPAVVVLDEKGRYAVSLLSGHIGGANSLSHEIADFLRGKAVITTASDLNSATPVDLWARDNSLVIENWDRLPAVSARLLNKGRLSVYSDIDIKMPDDFSHTGDAVSADILITNKEFAKNKTKLRLFMRPKNIVAGIGCNSGTSAEEIEAVVRNAFAGNRLSLSSLHSVATIDIKGREPGLIAFSERYGVKIRLFSPEELNTVKEAARSEAAFKATGAYAVAEPAVLLASGADRLLLKKQKKGNVTLALAEIKNYGDKRMKSDRVESTTNNGRIYIVGTGPGGSGHLTPQAEATIKEADTIVGYTTYLGQIQGLIRDKEIFSTGMTKEVDRCKKAVELARGGKTVAVISGGDPGVYAMAGLVFEILRNDAETRRCGDTGTDREHRAAVSPVHRFAASPVQVEVIPGISALNACAARLGAPLMHDFASISLSDRLTPWDVIEKRIEAAALADFVIVIYNPKSMGRTGHIRRAGDIIMKHRSSSTPVGIVKNAMREGERILITELGSMPDNEIDMQTTVIVGNSKTFRWGEWMITPRGYENKFSL